MSKAKDNYLSSLKKWEDELETNRYNMKHLAKRAIRYWEKEIEYFWPGLLKQREKDNGS